MERWERIAGYPAYRVSDLGRVKRALPGTSAPAGTILSTRGLRNGYPSVDLCAKGKRRSHYVHRLVAEAFIGDPQGREVNHINGNKSDPRAENLEYASRSENSLHAHRTGLQRCAGSRNGYARLTESSVVEIRRLATFFTSRELAARFRVTVGTVHDVVSRRTWSHV